MKKYLFPGKMKAILAALAILCLLGVSYVSLSVGGSGATNAAAFQESATPFAIQSGTPVVTDIPQEPDVTLGLVLAGILLMVVILFGTLYATRGTGNPPRTH
jgi:hypothetical protein